jgi:hypothetical protein
MTLVRIGKKGDIRVNAKRANMENLRVIQVKVVTPEKPLDVNTFPKNNPDVHFTIYIVSKYLCVDMASCDIQKYFMLI